MKAKQGAFRSIPLTKECMEGIYMGRKYFKGTIPPGSLSDNELQNSA
jgi:hypothetical protein